jgi:myo-inositol 2-dehydrogenase/D-chiro-inositol 1-dehydrogenase
VCPRAVAKLGERELTIRFGLIGAGVMGADHARVIYSSVGGAELVAIQDQDMSRAEGVAKSCGDASVFETAERLIADPGVDAVLIASPDATHAPLALACIAADKPALVEKPLAATLDECRAVIEAEVKRGRRLIQVGFMRRFDPGYLAMKQVLVENRLGAPLFFHCQHRNAVGPDYLTSELVIANSAVHEIDIARFLLDDDFAFVSVTSPRASRMAPGRQPQFLVMETKSGVVVDVEAYMDSTYGYEVKGEMVCEAGSIVLGPNPPIKLREVGQEVFAVEPDWRDRFRSAYREQIAGWVASIREGKPRGSSAWDGYAASFTAAACIEAWRSRTRTRVALADTPDFYR